MRLTSNLTRSALERAGFVVLAVLIASLVWSLHSSASKFGRTLKSNASPAESSRLPEPVQSPTPCCNDKPHLLVGTYYSVKNGLNAKLLLNNKGPDPLVASPTLFSISGERFDAPPVTIDGQSFQMIDMSSWVATAGPQFESGSIEVFHVGKDLVLGAQIYLVDEAHSLSFDEKLVETKTLKSSRLEGLWWMPSQKGQVLLALSNNSDSAITVTVNGDGHKPERAGQETLTFEAHQTRLLDMQADVIHQANGAMSKFGSISLQHSGAPGALLARAMVQEPSIGYSVTVQFSDPTSGKSSELHGVGLRLGSAGGESLAPVVVARNLANTTTRITGRVPYTTADGRGVVVPLPDVQLAPGDMAVFDVAKALREHGNPHVEAIGGLEFEYSTVPGSVMMAALSVSDSGNQVFRVPMWDAYAQRSPTGGYPWRIDANSSTMVYIKNAEKHPLHYYLQLRYPGGIYSLGVKTIEAGQTVSFDFRKLRDLQVPDADGLLLPLGASIGQVHWSKTGNETGMLIGRSEQVDTVLGISSNYACANCCPDNAVNARLVPNSDSAVISTSRQFIAQYQLTTCYGTYSDYLQQYDAEWSSNNENVASVSIGLAQANASGTATIKAEWYADHYVLSDDSPPGPGGIGGFGGESSCQPAILRDHLSATATFKAQVPTSLQVLAVNILPTGTSGDHGCTPDQDYGIEVAVLYQVKDQSGDSILSNAMEPQEQFEDGHWDDIGKSRISYTSQLTNSNGQFWDAPYGGCGPVPVGHTFSQPIRILLNSNTYPVRTNTTTWSGSASGAGTISNGSDIQKTRP